MRDSGFPLPRNDERRRTSHHLMEDVSVWWTLYAPLIASKMCPGDSRTHRTSRLPLLVLILVLVPIAKQVRMSLVHLQLVQLCTRSLHYDICTEVKPRSWRCALYSRMADDMTVLKIIVNSAIGISGRIASL